MPSEQSKNIKRSRYNSLYERIQVPWLRQYVRRQWKGEGTDNRHMHMWQLREEESVLNEGRRMYEAFGRESRLWIDVKIKGGMDGIGKNYYVYLGLVLEK